MHPALLITAPLSWLYGVGVRVRNWLYDRGQLRSRRFGLPVICVGNLTVGGTGKTPHVEYLIRLLSDDHRVAVLSRGYKRRSRGFVLADSQTPMKQIGDEPWQMKQKFGDRAMVAVDANRCRGIEQLQAQGAEVILLDDAFQHRAVTAGLNILLVDYNRLITDDRLLPVGRLREPVSGKDRADIIVVSKCPAGLSPIHFRLVSDKLAPRPFQSLFFSTLRYGPLRQLAGHEERSLDALRQDSTRVLLISGIGSPRQLENDLRPYASHIVHLAFPDHHYFSPADARRINQAFQRLTEPRIAITTEKDATRLIRLEGLDEEVSRSLYVLPVEVEIMRDKTQQFIDKILRYVQQNS